MIKNNAAIIAALIPCELYWIYIEPDSGGLEVIGYLKYSILLNMV